MLIPTARFGLGVLVWTLAKK